jgi:hypothetical protein
MDTVNASALRRFCECSFFKQAQALFGNGRNAAELVGPQPQTWLV